MSDRAEGTFLLLHLLFWRRQHLVKLPTHCLDPDHGPGEGMMRLVLSWLHDWRRGF